MTSPAVGVTAQSFHRTRDEQIIGALALKIRFASLSQISRTWWPENKSSERAQRRLRQLVIAGRLDMLSVRAHPELALAMPVWRWCPGEDLPPFASISYRLRVRWTEPLRQIAVYVASRKTARRFAGHGGRLPHPLQATHDLHVTGVFLGLRERSPEEAALWVPEEKFANKRRGQKLPDAELQDDAGRTLKVIEFGGSYSPERVRKVHEDCERRSVPYELW